MPNPLMKEADIEQGHGIHEKSSENPKYDLFQRTLIIDQMNILLHSLL